MRVLLICVGSRGDHEPFIALSQRLTSDGDHVEFFLQQDYEHLLPESDNLTRHVLPFGSNDFYQFVASPSHGATSDDPVERFIGVVTDCTGELVLPQWKSVHEAASSCDFLVTSSLARALMLPISQHLKIPLALIHLQPLLPTTHFPAHWIPNEPVDTIMNPSDMPSEAHEATYWVREKLTFEFLEQRVAKVCANMCIDPLSFEEVRLAVNGKSEGAWIVNAFADQLAPKPNDSGKRVLQIGPLAADYLPDEWEPEQHLLDFLENCDTPPVCLGFGSMPFGGAKQVFQGLKEYGQNTVLVGDALKPGDDADEWLQAHTCFVTHAQYAWLLPRCSLMVSHGGAGVMHAALRAGVPQVIAPLMGDQFFWGELIVAKGLGARCEGLLTELTAQKVAKGLSAAVKCADACKHVAESMAAQEKPTVALVRHMREVVGA